MDNFDLGLRALEKAGPVEKGHLSYSFADRGYFEKEGLTKDRDESGRYVRSGDDGGDDGDRERSAARRGG